MEIQEYLAQLKGKTLKGISLYSCYFVLHTEEGDFHVVFDCELNILNDNIGDLFDNVVQEIEYYPPYEGSVTSLLVITIDGFEINITVRGDMYTAAEHEIDYVSVPVGWLKMMGLVNDIMHPRIVCPLCNEVTESNIKHKTDCKLYLDKSEDPMV